MRGRIGSAKLLRFALFVVAALLLVACSNAPPAATTEPDVVVVTATGAAATDAPAATDVIQPTTAPTEGAAEPTEAPDEATEPATEAAAPGSDELGMSAANPVTGNTQWSWVTQEANGLEWVLVPAGCFTMGDKDGFTEETPENQQCFDAPFWITRTEITNQQFGSPGVWAGDKVPRTDVTWTEASAFCQGKGGRLLTEREWEYAARGPSNLKFTMGDTLRPGFVIHAGNATSPVEVGSQPDNASWVGAYDLLGNVREWVSSGWIAYPTVDGDGREKLPDAGGEARRVVRGGSYQTGESKLRSSLREFYAYDDSTGDIGVRCAMDYQP
jgi:formylglycine-generating enzyme required for sulfatase activity